LQKKIKMQINFKTIAAVLAMITQLSAATAQESLNTAGGVDRGRGGSDTNPNPLQTLQIIKN
jgi:hypothetical protein